MTAYELDKLLSRLLLPQRVSLKRTSEAAYENNIMTISIPEHILNNPLLNNWQKLICQRRNVNKSARFSTQDLEASILCRRRQRNAQRFITHVHNYCFSPFVWWICAVMQNANSLTTPIISITWKMSVLNTMRCVNRLVGWNLSTKFVLSNVMCSRLCKASGFRGK